MKTGRTYSPAEGNQMKIRNDGTVSRLLKDVPLPKMFHAEQTFPDRHIDREDIEKAIFDEINRSKMGERILPGKQIAITAGSRGIRNVDEITRSVVAYVRSRGAVPFIVPAMGSHGGATAEGQREMLAARSALPWKRCSSAIPSWASPSIWIRTPSSPTASSSPAA